MGGEDLVADFLIDNLIILIIYIYEYKFDNLKYNLWLLFYTYII